MAKLTRPVSGLRCWTGLLNECYKIGKKIQKSEMNKILRKSETYKLKMSMLKFEMV